MVQLIIMKKRWLHSAEQDSNDKLGDEWASQGGKLTDNLADVLTNILQRLKTLEENEKQ